IVPFAFCYDPGLILHGTLTQNLGAVAGGITAALSFGFAMEGFMAGPLQPLQRLLFFVTGFCSFFPFLFIKLPAVAATIILIVFLLKKRGSSIISGETSLL
ncbi:MAG: TRAP transporter permease, partial [Thermovirgaceae bacterium]|nr:TRAP transporter permease [Thermovirgaceae bacterium]